MTARVTVFKSHHELSSIRVNVSGVLRALILGETSLVVVTVCINSLGVCAIHKAIFHRAAVAFA